MAPPWEHRALAEQCGAHDAGQRWWPPGPPDPPDQVTYLERLQWQRSCLGERLLLACGSLVDGVKERESTCSSTLHLCNALTNASL